MEKTYVITDAENELIKEGIREFAIQILKKEGERSIRFNDILKILRKFGGEIYWANEED